MALLDPFRKRPWLVVVLGLGLFLLLDLVFLLIALGNPPRLLD